MSNKDTMENLRQKLFEKKKKLQIEEADEKIRETMNQDSYVVFQDSTKKGRHFLMIKIPFKVTYDEKLDKFTVESAGGEVREFGDKTAALAMVMDVENRKYLFNKCVRRKK
jgi:ribosomal protein L9